MTKARRRKATNPTRRTAPAVAGRKRSSDINLREQLDRSRRELNEALARETATADVLSVISSSPGELKPVFDAMLTNAVRLCQAGFGALWLPEGDGFRSVSLHNVPPALAEALRREPLVRFGPDSGSGQVVRTKQVVHIEDYRAAPAYLRRDPPAVSLVEKGGARSALFTPLQGRRGDRHPCHLSQGGVALH